MADELKDAIEKNAQGPRSARGDVGEVQQHSLTEQIEADRYLASREAGAKPHKALRFAKLSPARFARVLERQRKLIVHAATHPPWTQEARTMADRFHQHADSYFRFITTPGVEPTNDLAEQVLRFVVIDRRITQGTRGEAGRQWCERIWTVSSVT